MAVKQQGVIARTQEERAKDKGAPKSITEWIRSMQPAIKKALPSVITPERFTRIALNAVFNTPALGECTPQSFIAALMNAAQLGLEPNTPLGQAYLIPYKNNNKGVIECQFELGYKGIVDLAYRSGEISTIQAHEVYPGDDFEFVYGMESNLTHRPAMDEPEDDPIWYYALFRLVNGGGNFEVMGVNAIRKHAARYSESYKSSFSPWKTNFDEMAKKTVLKKVMKYAPIKTEFVRALETDGTIKTEIGEDMTAIPAEYTVRDDDVDKDTGEITGGMADDSGDEPLPWDDDGLKEGK